VNKRTVERCRSNRRKPPVYTRLVVLLLLLKLNNMKRKAHERRPALGLLPEITGIVSRIAWSRDQFFGLGLTVGPK